MTFADQGFAHLKGFFEGGWLDDFERQIVALYEMQASKIGDYRSLVTARPGDDAEQLCRLLEAMEGADKEALYQVQKFFPACQFLREFFDQRFMETCVDLLGGDRMTTLLEGPALFVNRPRTERLRYKPHSEAHYYPRRRRFLNCWFPIFGDRSAGNGSMSVWPGSHKREWPFAEYAGYNKDTEGKRNHFIQYDIPRNLIEAAGFEEVSIAAARGDLILFDRNLVHSSNENTSDQYSFACVARVWDPTDDLTLAGSMAVTPYGGDPGGRANLIVRP
jgi:hypothetical protein